MNDSGGAPSLGSIFNNIGSAVHNVNQGVSRARRRSGSGGGRRSTPETGSSRTGVRRAGGGGGGGGGNVRNTLPVGPATPSINSYLGTDSAYQNALSSGKRSLTSYLADINRRRGEATTQFNNTKASMERDRAQQLDDIRQEFASRGLINSGLFADEQGKFQKQFTDQLNSLGQQQTGLLADLLSQQNNYQREYQNAIEQAKQEALARRAAKYGITG